MSSLLHFLLILLLFSSSLHCLSSCFQSSQLINHVLLVDDKIFVGAVNNVSILSATTLTLQHSVPTGPLKDSNLCSHDGTSCLRDARPSLTETHNKLLALTPSGLLVCGSTRLGTCSLHSSTDLSLSQTGDVPVVGNSPDSSTVWIKTRKGVIVAASPTSESPYRDPFPAVSLRMLSDLSIANSGSLEGEAAVYLREEYRSLVRYITAFQHGHFVYIASVQGRKPVTKLIRFCANDTRFISYSEIELQCRSEDNSNYPDLTAAALEGDRLIGSFSDSSFKRSAICVFPMSRLALTYWYNLDRCRGGSDSIGLPHIGRDKKCTNKSRMPLSEDTCEMGVGGSIESVHVASWESRGTVTAMVAAERVVVVGMKDGSLIKLKWGDQQQLEKYAETSGGGESIRSVTLDNTKMLIQTDHEIRWIPLADCSSSTTCTSCLVSEDPLCQWCHSTNQCQTSSSCPTATVDICPADDGPPQPSNLPVGTRSTVFLPVRHLPQPSHYKYECVFGQSISEAFWSEKGVRCAAPSISLTNGQKQLVLKLRTSLSSHHILQYNYSFYACQQLNTCGECVQMEGCDWCSAAGQCLTKGSCSGDSSKECARIVEKEILLAADVSQDLELEVVNVNKLPKTGLSCRLNKNRVVNATLEGKTVSCKGVKIKVTTSNQTVPIELLNNGALVDVSQVSVYDCSFLAADCSSCAALEQKWSCGWCSGRCSVSCVAHSASECDRPHISSFHPHSGPQEGGTVITISGRDLGTSIEDVKDRVFVGGSKCQVIGYEISRTIRCVVEKGTLTGSVRVAVGRSSKRTAETRDLFSFVEVSLQSVSPLFAPVSGGTKLTFYGSNLNSGTNVTINVGSIPCPVIHRNTSKSLTCLIESVPYPQTASLIELTIDASTVKMTTTFEFRPDPVVSSIRPSKVWKSGGKPLIIEGKNFDSVSSAKTFLLGSSGLSAEVVSDTSTCQIVNSTTMYCLSPRLVHSDRTSLKYSRYPIGFAMDAVSAVRNLGPRIQLSVTPDPQLTPFHGTRVHQANQPLILDGIHLNEAADINDYKIFIGKERCYVTLVDSRQLVCNAPVKQPESTDENGTPILDAPMVTVTIGRVRRELGLLEYSTPLHTIQLWLPVALLLLALVFVLFLFFCLWRRKKTEKERDYRKIQLQLEELEGNIRKECKTAFAELHTAMSFNPEDNDGAEVNSLKEFVNRLLWMDGNASSSPSLYATRHPLTLAQFDSLLSSKHFIFAIVDAADADPSVSLQEKSLLSSLLVQALLRNFHYLTVVVMDLLRAHIAKTVHNGNASLLFRSSESLVEKLVGKWLSIAMYPYVVDNQAHSFLQLYKALKCQAERGPVDEITGKARYTINESMLLREAVDSVSIDLLVMDLKGKGPFMLKVQSCDSIGQIKSKLLDVVYKGTRYSHRPSTRTFDLEWHCPRRGPVTLTETEHSSRRLNTLERFGVPPGALLLMSPGPFEHRNSAGDSGQCSWSSLERAPSATPSLPGLFHLTQPSGQTMDKRKKIDDTIPKNIPEVYLTRLLTSKTTVQNYIEDLLEGAVYSGENSYPAPLNFIFDLLDEEAARNGVEAAVAHQWKSNLYALRFWAVLLNRPRLIFDLPPLQTVEADLTVVSQTLVDCFSSSEPTAGLSSSRLLFSKEVGRIRHLAGHFMERISRQPLVDEHCLAEHLNQLATELSSGSSTAALAELLDSWIRGNGLRIAEVLSADPGCVAARLPQRLSQIVALDSQPTENIYSTISEYAA